MRASSFSRWVVLKARDSHQTPEALMMGFQGNDPETIDTGTISSRYAAVLENRTLLLGGTRRIKFNMERDMVWRFDEVLKTHPL